MNAVDTLGSSQRFRWVLAISCLLIANLALADAPTEQDWQQLNSAIIDQQVIPGYQQLANSTARLAADTEQLCLQPDDQQLQTTQASYRQAMHDWQSIKHINFGPVTLLMRNFALQYWPDKRNTGSSQLREALADPSTDYNAEFFSHASISVKGFPALERILFNDTGIETLSGMSAECRLAQGIASHVHQMAVEIHSEWSTMRERMLGAGDNNYFDLHADAATLLMKSLAESPEALRDNKILAPLGDSYDRVRWQRSESWRSEQSIGNLRANLDALHALYSGSQPISVKELLVKADEPALADTLEQQFIALKAQLDSLDEVKQNNVSERQYQQLSDVADGLKQLHTDLNTAMYTLNIQLGFNSRDGD
ncbi:imelysin family protein [Nitrincola iocasae]|uniref:Imelysin family protein n=1 Tax=Nitrincola iocasae TaxID=2614693 RepID=A0A5J6LI25_9GAMM|nr:imelysin family protein [Nitrincola iocasae]QEW07761.1 imelysin family protein [Nitrincola iocasae]